MFPKISDWLDRDHFSETADQKWNFGPDPAKILRFRTKRGPGPTKIFKFCAELGPEKRGYAISEMVVSESSVTNIAMLVTDPKNRCNY